MRFFSIALTVLLLAMAALGLVAVGLIQIPDAYNPARPLDLRAPRTFVTPFKLWRIGLSPQLCRAALDDARVIYKTAPDQTSAMGCTLTNTVLLSSLGGIALHPAGTQLSCPLAARLVIYGQNDLQNAARDEFGDRVTRIDHYGSYACRNIYNRKTARLSKNATANAIDVAAFTLSNGRRVSVLKDWDAAGGSARFLKRAHEGACGLFSAVLGPDYNAAHKNHFHLENGFFGICR